MDGMGERRPRKGEARDNVFEKVYDGCRLGERFGLKGVRAAGRARADGETKE